MTPFSKSVSCLQLLFPIFKVNCYSQFRHEGAASYSEKYFFGLFLTSSVPGSSGSGICYAGYKLRVNPLKKIRKELKGKMRKEARTCMSMYQFLLDFLLETATSAVMKNINNL